MFIARGADCARSGITVIANANATIPMHRAVFRVMEELQEGLGAKVGFRRRVVDRDFRGRAATIAPRLSPGFYLSLSYPCR